MFPAGNPAPAAAPAPAQVAQPAIPPAQVAPAAVAVPRDGVQSDGLVQGSLHPGEMNPAPSAQVAANAAVNAATEQLPPGAVTPESAALSSSARAIAAQMGFGAANQFQDDRTFLEAVLGQAQAANAAQQQLAAMQNYQAALLQAQQQAAQMRQQPAAAPAKPQNAIWNPPEYNPAWQSLVRTDDKGIPTLIPGAPAEILPKYLAYQQYRQQFADKFLSNPEETLLPLINATAEERARAMVKQEIDARQEQAYVQSFVQENSAWLHQRDAQNQPLRDPASGQPLLSAAGKQFQRYLVQASESGITGMRQQESYAKAFLQRDILMAQEQERLATAGSQQAVIEANRRPGMAGMTPQPGVAPPPAVGSSLQEQMLMALSAHGITDAAIDM